MKLQKNIVKGERGMGTRITLARGFNVDFSEDNDPIDELGDKPRPFKAEGAPTHSEVDDVELPGRPREFIA